MCCAVPKFALFGSVILLEGPYGAQCYIIPIRANFLQANQYLHNLEHEEAAPIMLEKIEFPLLKKEVDFLLSDGK